MASAEAQLIQKLLSSDNKVVVQAIEELRASGALNSGALRRAHLRFVHLRGANLHQANLQEANLNLADLQGADLSMADLQEARLTKANLRRADLNEANLHRAFLAGANLQGARNATETQLAQASKLRGATMPDGGQYDGRFNLPGDIEDARNQNVDTDDPAVMADFYGILVEDYQDGQRWVHEHLVIAVEAKRTGMSVER